MLRWGGLNGVDCQGRSRRAFLHAGSLAALGLSWPAALRMQAAAADARPPRSMILLWLWGGPSHLDTFDLKPQAPQEFRGPYQPIATNVPGIEVCELLPRLARCADKYAIVRSLHHDTNDHGIGGTVGLTSSMEGAASLGGTVVPGQLRPTHGSIVTRIRGFRPDIPSFIALGGNLNQGHRPIRGEGGGSLGTLYDPFRLDYETDVGVKIPELDLIPGLTSSTLNSRHSLLAAMDQLPRRLDNTPAVQRFDQFYQQAFSLLTSGKARKFFDLDQEPPAVQNAYGHFRFGQCCLMARRLVESGVPFVQVNWSSHVEPVEDGGDGGWDMHDRNFSMLQERHAWMLDQSVSALLNDLDQRGLLEQTVVMAVGEFGRTPRINGKAGRDHWEHCYSGLVAGGGLQCGQVVGASDALGERPASRPMSPGDLAMTMYGQLGIGTTQLTGVGLTPPGEVVEELL